jgi:hypothetical protein
MIKMSPALPFTGVEYADPANSIVVKLKYTVLANVA